MFDGEFCGVCNDFVVCLEITIHREAMSYKPQDPTDGITLPKRSEGRKKNS